MSYKDIPRMVSEFLLRRQIGRYYSSQIAYYSTTTIVISADTLFAIPFWVAFPRETFDRIAINVSTGTGTVGDVARLGIYRDNGDCYPSDLILDAGEVAVDTVGVKEITISQILEAGLYWLALLANSAPTLRAVYAHYNIGSILLGLPSTLDSIATHYSVSQTYGALPSPFPTGATYQTSANAPLIALRKA